MMWEHQERLAQKLYDFSTYFVREEGLILSSWTGIDSYSKALLCKIRTKKYIDYFHITEDSQIGWCRCGPGFSYIEITILPVRFEDL